MSTTRAPPTTADGPSAVQTEYYLATGASASGVKPRNIALPASDVATDNECTSSIVDAQGTPSLGPSSSPIPTLPEYTLFLDEDGILFLRDVYGSCYEITRGASDALFQSSLTGVPMHHLRLFGPSTRGPSTESDLSDLTPAGELPQLNLDIDPDLLDSTQISQLNAIHEHLGSMNSRIITTTAMVAEHQAATEQMQDNIQQLRRDVLSRVDSLRNEVNSQRSRLNRVLDDNLRVVLETGASNDHVAGILNTMSKNGGAHRMARAPPAQLDDPSVAPREPLPSAVKQAVDTAVSPRTAGESHESFDRCAQATLRTKEATLAAFPLPVVDTGAPPLGPRTAGFVPPPADPYLSVGSASRAHIRFEQQHTHADLRQARMLDAGDRRHETPVTMNNSTSAYVSGAGGVRRDVLTEFADDAADVIQEIIFGKVGTRIQLPPDRSFAKKTKTDQPNDQTPSEPELRAGQNGTRDRGRMMKIGGLDDTTRQVMRERTALVFGDRQRDKGSGPMGPGSRSE
ncbi:hypothetical protein C8F04DRAFT_1192386 [Mycena alexandri]|uniref:Uncharacterized protein n=1 Tax=Mycena alexandri TaxID=1745969 RepID=A0AAD6SCI6_9AGAR|nr:hypothetical protein C8F04DRAFT_1192386 [Mycena alexandri]